MFCKERKNKKIARNLERNKMKNEVIEKESNWKQWRNKSQYKWECKGMNNK